MEGDNIILMMVATNTTGYTSPRQWFNDVDDALSAAVEIEEQALRNQTDRPVRWTITTIEVDISTLQEMSWEIREFVVDAVDLDAVA